MRSKGLQALTSWHNGYQAREVSVHAPLQSVQLMKLFEDELKDIYWVAKALMSSIPKMIKNATSGELVNALSSHLTETENQVSRVEWIFKSLHKRPSSRRCLAIEGLMKEVEQMMESSDAGAMCDAGIISAEQKVKHYEIASCETLRQFAETLGLDEAVVLFESSLEEHRASVELFSGVSVFATHFQDNTEDLDDESELEHEQDFQMQFV